MYKLSEQPVVRILDEMVNFRPLYHRVAVCKVKAPFSINDINYEKGDIVAISGYAKSKISVEYYQDLKKRRSFDIHDRVRGDDLSISVDEFRELFELCEDETIKVENMIEQAQSIEYEKYNEILQKRAEPLDEYGRATIGMTAIIVVALMLFWSIFKPSIKEFIVLLLFFLSIILVFFLFNFIKDMKYRVIERKYLDKYNEMDKQREQSGMYIPESEK